MAQYGQEFAPQLLNSQYGLPINFSNQFVNPQMMGI